MRSKNRKSKRKQIKISRNRKREESKNQNRKRWNSREEKPLRNQEVRRKLFNSKAKSAKTKIYPKTKLNLNLKKLIKTVLTKTTQKNVQ